METETENKDFLLLIIGQHEKEHRSIWRKYYLEVKKTGNHAGTRGHYSEHFSEMKRDLETELGGGIKIYKVRFDDNLDLKEEQRKYLIRRVGKHNRRVRKLRESKAF